MHYDFVAIPDADVPRAAEPTFQHLLTTYASETNKTASMWRAVPDDRLDFKPHEKVNTIRTILVHQLLSERRFFAQFVGTAEPPVEELLPAVGRPGAGAGAYGSPLHRPREAFVAQFHFRLDLLDQDFVTNLKSIVWSASPG